MFYSFRRILLLSLAFTTILSAPVFAAEFSVLWPPDNFLTAAATVRIIIEAQSGKADTIRLQVNQQTVANVALKDKAFEEKFGGMVHKILSLQKGKNLVKIEALAGGKVLETKEINLVFKNIRQSDVTVPEGFVNKRFHIPTQEAGCACHTLDSQEADKLPKQASDSTCYTCHYDKTRVLYLHGPVGAFQCLACHNPKDPQQKNKVIARDAELCYKCHELKEKEFKKKFIHGPLGTGKCEICHDAHGSNYPYWLFAKVNDVCFNCHGKGFANHPIAGHPTDNLRDPSRKGKTLSCASCHDPHASDNRRFLSLATDYMGTCRKCHRK